VGVSVTARVGAVGGRDGFGFVDRRFELCWSRRPLIMAIDWGGLRRTCSAVISGKVVNQPASVAANHVEIAGENKVAWAKAMRSVRVL
jgi:hypothetical protein